MLNSIPKFSCRLSMKMGLGFFNGDDGKNSKPMTVMQPELKGRWREMVANLETVLEARDVPHVRTALRDVLGEIQVIAAPQQIRFETRKGAIEGDFLRAAGGQHANFAAGARFAMFLHCRCDCV